MQYPTHDPRGEASCRPRPRSIDDAHDRRRLAPWLAIAVALAGCGDAGQSAPCADAGDGGSPSTDAPMDVAHDDGGEREATCAHRGQQCWGTACCAGEGTCDAVEIDGMGTTYACGGVVASGAEARCTDTSTDASCTWVDVIACDPHATIADFCPGRARPVQLKRCSWAPGGDTCFAPDALYQEYQVCGCGTPAGPGVPGSCADCAGSQWQAVLCCTP